MSISKRQRSQRKAPTGQIQDNLSNKINKGGNRV